MSEKPQTNRLRFTLRTVFAVVTIAAIGSAALAKPTELWASVVFSGTLGMLFCVTLTRTSRNHTG